LIVIPYTELELIKLLTSKFTPFRVVQKKNHVAHLLKLFNKEYLYAMTMVIEDSYVNRDYLIDYQHFYSRCFENYPKHCKRIHFFSLVIAQAELEELILQEEDVVKHKLEPYYIGSIVVKPIPTRIIGYTLLANPFQAARQEVKLFGVRDYFLGYIQRSSQVYMGC
jgi:hypothetical protein